MVADVYSVMGCVEFEILLSRDLFTSGFHRTCDEIYPHKIYNKKPAREGHALVFNIYNATAAHEYPSSQLLLRTIYGGCGVQLL